MDYQEIISKLDANQKVFAALLSQTSSLEYSWKADQDDWSLLEIVCHLHDEEREDFRVRINHCLASIEGFPPSIDPEGWVKERAYVNEEYEKMLDKFLLERKATINWLKSLSNPAWDNSFIHPEFGEISAGRLLFNWLAHDLLHIRQITKIKYLFLKDQTNEDISYAGNLS